MALCKGTEENRRTGKAERICSPIFDDNFWRWRYDEMDTKYVGLREWQVRRRGIQRKVKRKGLREERRRVEKRPLSRLQTDNGNSVETRCRKTSRKLSDGSYFIDLYS